MERRNTRDEPHATRYVIPNCGSYRCPPNIAYSTAPCSDTELTKTKAMNPSRREDEPLLSTSNATANLVTFGPNDPDDPRNWPKLRKWLMIAAIIPIDLSVSWGASGFSPAAGDFAKDVGVSPHVATLGLSLYVLGL
jgi:hypothetical protein